MAPGYARRACLLALLAGMLLAPAGARSGGGPIVAMFDMEDRGSGLEPEVLENLIDYMAALLTEGGYQVVPRDQIRERLVQRKKSSYRTCIEQSCQIELGRELAAQKTLSTKILRIGDTCKVTAVMYDLKRAATESAATAGSACEVNQLLEAVTKISAKLCAPLADARRAADAGLAEFERIRKDVAHDKAERERMKKAWEIVSTIARDDQVDKEVRIEALEKFLAEFQEDSPYLPEARKLMADISPAVLVVRTVPEGAEVIIAGQPAGRSPVTQKLKAGEYKLAARLEGYRDAAGQAKLKTGQRTEVALKLEPIPPGKLVVHTDPPGARVSIDGGPAAEAPLTRELTPGSHRVTAELDGHDPAELSAATSAGRTTEVSLKLSRSTPMHPYTLWGHVSFWSGLGMAAFGGASMALSMQAADDYDSGDPAAADSSRNWVGAMLAGFGTGAALITTGVVLWLLAPEDTEQAGQTAASAAPTPDGRGMVFSIVGRW